MFHTWLNFILVIKSVLTRCNLDQMLKFTSKTILVLSILILLIPSSSVNAQNTIPSGPIYIVQDGDTLWDIAYRFHISQTDLAKANGILNANEISIGQKLVIPGLEGVQAILTTKTVPYGENLHSLSLRYQVSPQVLKQLNHITSPNELFTGYSLVIPQEDTYPTLGNRVSLNKGQSLLELAILNDTDPWTVMGTNNLDNSLTLLPGEVLRTPGGNDAGPGALPAEITSLSITSLTQGQTAEIQVDGGTGLSIGGSLIDYPLNFFPTSDDRYIALQGVYAMAEPGLYPLSIQVNTSTALSFGYSQMVMVHAGEFLYDRTLPVDAATLDPETNRVENELWLNSASPVSPEKFWNGNFFIPVEPVFAKCYSSRFGSRRSYNGSEYIYFHTGLDFCGQVGDPVYAAASGIVVFTGPLTVRGNATMIDHGWGVYTAYMHQSEILVNVGDRVEEGQLIGRVGRTGRAEGPHLHFEVLVGGVQVDPLGWLNQGFP